MSVVAIRKTEAGFAIAVDSASTWGNTISRTSDKLLRPYTNLVIGCVGPSKVTSMMRSFVAVPKNFPDGEGHWHWTRFAQGFKKYLKEHDLDMSGSSFLIVSNGEGWLVNDLHVTKVLEYEAIGAGREFALAALYLGKSAAEACEVAINLCHYCAGPVIATEIARLSTEY